MKSTDKGQSQKQPSVFRVQLDPLGQGQVRDLGNTVQDQEAARRTKRGQGRNQGRVLGNVVETWGQGQALGQEDHGQAPGQEDQDQAPGQEDQDLPLIDQDLSQETGQDTIDQVD